MLKRLTRVGLSFAIVAAAYGLYALTVVRWIEPQVRASQSAEVPEGAGGRVDIRLNKHDALFEKIFPPGAWERQQPKVLESNQAMLLLDEHRPLGENRMELVPCTLIFFPQPREQADDSPQGAPIVLQARDGAELEFDGPLDLSRGEIGRLIGGRLRGEVVIFRRETAPGAGDGLEVVTSDVQMDSQRIQTPHPVRFQFGRNSGSGRNLIISLLPPEDMASQHGPAIGGLKSLELVQVDKVRLQMAGRRPVARLGEVGKAAGRQCHPERRECRSGPGGGLCRRQPVGASRTAHRNHLRSLLLRFPEQGGPVRETSRRGPPQPRRPRRSAQLRIAGDPVRRSGRGGKTSRAKRLRQVRPFPLTRTAPPRKS